MMLEPVNGLGVGRICGALSPEIAAAKRERRDDCLEAFCLLDQLSLLVFFRKAWPHRQCAP
jgi:hypothetical protein